MAGIKIEDSYGSPKRLIILFLFIAVCPLPLSPIPNSSCYIDIAPDETIAALNDETVNVTCTANCYGNIMERLHKIFVYERKPNGQYVHTNIECPHLFEMLNDTAVRSNCSGTVDTNNKENISIVCYGRMHGGANVTSNEVQLLVQGTIENITGLTIRKVNNLLNISWTPVFAYDGLNLFYEIHLNEIVRVLSNTSFKYDTSKLDPCEKYLNISITPFINTTENNNLTGRTHSIHIPIDAPPNNTTLNYSVIMTKSGSVHMNFLIGSCDCPAIPTNNLTLKNDAYSFSVTVPVVSNGTCLSTASVVLSLYMDFEVDVYLDNIVGSTKQNQTILIDTNPLVSFTFMNGTPGVLTALCNFTNDVVIINDYATGCMVFYTDMDEPVYAMRNNESTVPVNITNISSSGYYDVYVMVLPAPVRSSHSEYISVEPNPSSTAHHSQKDVMFNISLSGSSPHSSNSTSITPTPTTSTHTTSFSPSTSISHTTSISSSPSCTPCTEHRSLIYAGFGGGLIMGIIGLIVGICISCAFMKCKQRRTERISGGAEADPGTQGEIVCKSVEEKSDVNGPGVDSSHSESHQSAAKKLAVKEAKNNLNVDNGTPLQNRNRHGQ